MQDFIQNVLANWDTYYTIATSVIGTAAVIAAVTGSKSDDKIVAALLKVVNFLGANIGKAENKS